MCGHPFFSVHTPLLTAGLYPQPTRNRLLATVDWTTGTLAVGHCHLNEKLSVLRLQAPWRQHTLALVKVRALQGKRRERTERRGDGRGEHSSNESWLFCLCDKSPFLWEGPRFLFLAIKGCLRQRAAQGLWNQVDSFSGVLRDAELGGFRRLRGQRQGWGLPLPCTAFTALDLQHCPPPWSPLCGFLLLPWMPCTCFPGQGHHTG